MSDQHHIFSREEELTFVDNTKPTSFVFGDLLLDTKGFHYKGESIKDLGKAYEVFMEFMEKANHPLISPTTDKPERLAELIKSRIEYFESEKMLTNLGDISRLSKLEELHYLLTQINKE